MRYASRKFATPTLLIVYVVAPQSLLGVSAQEHRTSEARLRKFLQKFPVCVALALPV
jgi:hypothetical protein